MVVRVAQGSDWFDINRLLLLILSEWWVKAGGKQSPLSALGSSELR
jgi:hypothetical protein